MSSTASPWMRPVEYPVVSARPVEDQTAAGGAVLDVLEPLTAALEQVRGVFAEVLVDGADQDVSMADLAVVVEQANLLERAAAAVSIAATAGYARRESHDHPDRLEESVESIRARGFVHEWCAQEVGHLVRVSARTADTRVSFAADVAAVMPHTLAAVAGGAIEAWQAQNILAFLREVEADDETIREIDAYLAGRLAGTDPSRLLALTRYALGRIRPDLLPERAKKARADRGLEKWEIEPGLTELTARMPTHQAAAIWSAASTLAKDYRRERPELSLDQARLDAFVDLALANVTISTSVTLGVPVVTSAYARTGEAPIDLRDPEAPPPGSHDDEAAGYEPADQPSAEDSVGTLPLKVPDWAAHPDSTGPAFTPPPGCTASERAWWMSGVHLPGIGYVPPDVLQSLITTFGTTISTALLDSATGTLLSFVHRGYRPPRAMAELVRARDGRCRFFGCTLPVTRCDLDHAIPWQDTDDHPEERPSGPDHPGDVGITSAQNLAGLCRRHHRAKQHRQWTYLLDPDTGTAWWTNTLTGAWRTTLPALSTGPLEPPAPTGSCDPPRRADHGDDRPRINRILAVALGDTSPISEDQPDTEPIATRPIDGHAPVGPPEPMTPGDCLSPASTIATARKTIPDPTDPPPF